MNKKIEDIKKIISFFLETDPDKIGFNTLIDNSILQGSVKIHMMYGELADNGYKVSDYTNIKTFGELLRVLNLDDELDKVTSSRNNTMSNDVLRGVTTNDETNNNLLLDFKRYPLNIGIDLLNINKMPKVKDFRESSFYTDNFSKQEIAYCLTKKNPYKSFAGKFAAKEAIVKANNEYKNYKFNKIEVLNDANGIPYFDNFSISISHEDDLVIAIALLMNNLSNNKVLVSKQESNDSSVKDSIESRNEVSLVKKKINFNKSLIFSLVVNVLLISYIIYLNFFS